MVITLTLNPALDATIIVEEVHLGALNRIPPIRYDGSGKGINVATALKLYGWDDVEAFCVLGGQPGRAIARALEERGIACRAFWCEEPTRTNTKIWETRFERFTELNEPGPRVPAGLLEQLRVALVEEGHAGDIAVLSGSMPPGVPVSYYARLVKELSQRGVRVVLDADGEAFRLGVAERPWMLKPNRFEAEQLFGEPIRTPEAEMAAALRLRQLGAEIGIVTLGEHGAVFATPEGSWRVRAPRVEVKSAAGCGDALLAALLAERSRGRSWKEASVWAVAAASASATLEGTRFATRAMVDRLVPRMAAEEEGAA
ncbi:hexose kinase [Carboxydochorda subterranea]|uniref:Tagatose-6-phosphate kinase n=1 Tax=Carboxydichorda subterranea TaxID=3109565 RepID=A0ABZ1BWQ6_9FIRM|nr:hexose kinase [Limnochorda sp. L945t]WRP16543.1 hexose kinase [Limnochorda sp. L945t]